MAFLLLLSGLEVPQPEITPAFESPSTFQPSTQAQARLFEVSSGIPLRTER